jgi:hypothetical protein
MNTCQVELRLEITAPQVQSTGGAARAAGRVRTVLVAEGTGAIEGPWVEFESPLQTDDLHELKWYLETQPTWFKPILTERAAKVEASLPRWGKSLFDVTVNHPDQRHVYEVFRAACSGGSRLHPVISVIVEESDLGEV